MKVKNNKKGFIINIVSKNGKPIETKQGFVEIKGADNYMGCSTITMAVLENDFNWDGK